MSDTITRMPPVRSDQLREIGLFGGLSDDALATLSSELRTHIVHAGADVVREGEFSREMFVVLNGELEVVRQSKEGVEGRVAVLGPGSWFGEMSILDVQARSATVRAIAPTLLVRIAADDLDRLYRRDLKSYLMMVLNIARELSRRLRVADGMIAGFMATVWDNNMGFGPRKPTRTGPPQP